MLYIDPYKNIAIRLLMCCWCLGGIGLSTVQAQDPHFSQFYNSPLTLNPAITGLMNDDIRIIANYRSQWGAVATPFRTMALSADVSAFRDYLDDDVLGFGLLLMNDKAGQSELRNTQVQLSLGYSKALNDDANNYISIGGQAGFVQSRMNVLGLLFENQFDGGALNSGLPSGEDIVFAGVNYWDVSAGIAWAYTPDRFNSYYLGTALFHINQPRVSFMENSEELLHTKTTVYGGMELRANYNMSLLPRAVVLLQGPSREVNIGVLAKFNFGNVNGYDDITALYVGTMHRFKDAQVIITRLDYGPLGISFSYDINISSLSNASKGHGAAELAVMYKSSLFQPNRRRDPVMCPAF
ncbi:MAG: PorP/SprF family type IX secretion system membrane protein [Bacteroidota bacterium]